MFRPGVAFFVLSLAMICAGPSFAQLNATGTGLSTTGAGLQRTLKGSTSGPKEEPSPPVLPGTKAPTEAAQPTIAPTEMTPTEALFDAINRGDLAGSRDAVNRGAELDAPNVLGLTPLELSVDLGRNDISFMLLSMRGDSASARLTARLGVQGGGIPGGGAQGGSMRQEAQKASRPARVISASARGEAEEPLTATPRYSSGNGGAPIPAAGFLGFDEGRTSR
jgi:hypothetical protein